MFNIANKLKVQGKIIYGYVVILVFLVIISIVATVGVGLVNVRVNDLFNGAQAVETSLKDCRIQVNVAGRYIREMAINTDASTYPGYETNIKATLKEIENKLKEIKDTGVLSDELYERYHVAITDWMSVGNSIVKEISAGNDAKAVQMILTECAPALEQNISIAQEINTVTDQLKSEAIDTNHNTMYIVIGAVLASLFLAILFAVLIGNKIVRSILKPLQEIDDAAQAMTEGNIHTEINYTAEDELGELAESFRESMFTLQSYIADIDHAMMEFSNNNFEVEPTADFKGDFVRIETSFKQFQENISKVVRNIQKVANQVNRASEQVSANANELAEGATEQASITGELSITIETVTEKIKENAQNATAISNEVQSVGVDIEGSNNKMQEMVLSMNDIAKASDEISKIIATINDIASQTNLLALNASIEAARAGEAGRGFAVVADQVSALAAQSAEAAKESTQMIENSVRAVKNGTVIAEETAQKLERVLNDSKDIVSKVNTIAEDSENQAVAVAQIREGVGRINNVVHKNLAASEECAATSQEMNGQAEVLKELIRKFKVGKFN